MFFVFINNLSFFTNSYLFAYGVLIYEIVTRKDPWEGDSAVIATHRVIEGERMKIPASCPPVLMRVMELCWKENPVDRPNFSEIVDMLKEKDPSSQSQLSLIVDPNSESKMDYNNSPITYDKSPGQNNYYLTPSISST